jgi:hypothetical protein
MKNDIQHITLKIIGITPLIVDNINHRRIDNGISRDPAEAFKQKEERKNPYKK